MRDRRRQGVIYVEALVVVPLLTALFAGALYIGRAYDARIAAGQRAREQAWREAMPGCVRELSPDDALLSELRAVRQRGDGYTQLVCNERARRMQP
ncbi:MAG: TadE family protein [Polyangiales bacterium]